MKGVYIKRDRIVSTFEFWSYHDREIYWTQHYLLSLLWCNLIYGHWISIIFLISQSGGQVRSWALWADLYKVKFYYFERIVCWTGFSVKLIVLFLYSCTGGLCHHIWQFHRSKVLHYVQNSHFFVHIIDKYCIHSRWDQHSLCFSTILFFRNVDDN